MESISTGLLKCVFMPHCRDRWMSSAKAFAESAKIGIRPRVFLVMPRMCRVASRPSMTGIRTSIRIAAYSPRFGFRKALYRSLAVLGPDDGEIP